MDANIIIYAFKPEYQYIVELLEAANEEIACSDIVRLEVMGFAGFENADMQKVAQFFNRLTIAPITTKVIDAAINIRQKKSIKSPDAIIAATALVTKQKLWTNNEEDFAWIKDLKWHNPIPR